MKLSEILRMVIVALAVVVVYAAWNSSPAGPAQASMDYGQRLRQECESVYVQVKAVAADTDEANALVSKPLFVLRCLAKRAMRED